MVFLGGVVWIYKINGEGRFCGVKKLLVNSDDRCFITNQVEEQLLRLLAAPWAVHTVAEARACRYE